METRDILDHLGNIIGELNLPLDTTEEIWSEKLASYAYVRSPPTLKQIVDQKIVDAVNFGTNFIIMVASDNVMSGITQAGKTKEVSDYCRALQRYLKEGSLYAAVEEMDRLIAEGTPEDLAPFITIERINFYKAKIEAYLA